MTTCKNIDNIDRILELFEAMRVYKDRAWLWQKTQPNNNQNRIIQFGVVKHLDHLKKQIHLKTYRTKKFHFERSEPIYLFSQDHLVATKMDVKSCYLESLSFAFPQQLTMVDNEFFERLELIEVEDDQRHKHLRNTPRKTLNKDKLATLVKVDGTTEFLNIYDISDGGLSVLIEDPGQYLLGEAVKITSVDGKNLKNTLCGEVRNISRLSNDSSVFKVGIKLDD